jgi:two-component system, NtrC family, sensor kinase
MKRARQYFKNLSISKKISAAILLTCGTALAVAGAAIFVAQLATFRQSFTSDLDAIGQMLGHNTTASITFNDRKGAEDLLAAVRAKPYILRASLALPDGREFASFLSSKLGSAPSLPGGDGIHQAGRYLALNQPVILAGERIATLTLLCDYQTEYDRSLRLYAAVLFVVLLVSVLLALVISHRLQRLITAPLLKLTGTAQSVAEKEDYSLRAPKLSLDEVGQLADAFNGMLAKIQAGDRSLREANLSLGREVEERKRSQNEVEKLHKELMDVSRQAGMAEVATGVLHNVGNVLNSVNVSVNLVNEQLGKSQCGNLVKLSALIDAHRADLPGYLGSDPKGRRVPDFLSQLSQALLEERNQMLGEMGALVKNLDHVKEIVAMQQSYAKVAGVTEDLPAADLVEDALRMNEGAFLRHGITIKREFETVPPVRVDKHKVLQILINLFRNAKYAMQAAGREERILNINVRAHGTDRVEVLVRDNGIGIEPENLTRIFGHGFTTKQDGHGFGLHSGALAAKEMGGSLQAQSEGPGKGATFILELPANSESQNHL